MRIFLLFILLQIGLALSAQTKLNFNYDGAGNQISRTLCINCSSKSVQDVVEPAMITDNDLEKFLPEDVISYHPNPVREELYLQWELTQDNFVVSVNLYSVAGQSLQRYHLNNSSNNLTIPFQQYSAGVYLVLLSYKNGGEKSIKIIKK